MKNITGLLLTTNKRNPYLYRATAIYKSLLIKHQVILTTSNHDFCGKNKSFRIQVHLSPANNYQVELAYFSICGNYIRAPFEQLARLKDCSQFSPPSMNINCEDYQGQRVSKMLILVAFHFAKKEYPRFNDGSELFIDTDASSIVGKDACGNKVSYWSAIGMVNNDVAPSNEASIGYEKRCFVRDLHPYLFR